MATKLWAVALMVMVTFFTSVAQLFYKLGSASITFNILSIITNYYLYIGVFLYIFGFVLMIKAFKGGEVTILYPIVSTSYIWVGFLSVLYLGETLNFLKWAGIITIVFGIIFINIGSSATKYTEAL